MRFSVLRGALFFLCSQKNVYEEAKTFRAVSAFADDRVPLRGGGDASKDAVAVVDGRRKLAYDSGKCSAR